MVGPESPQDVLPSRPMRADAQRNRAAILAAARRTFDAEGVLAPIDRIAVRAGVGNATLYRNFPTRDDLLAAVMQQEIAAAVSEAEELTRTAPAGEALAGWLVALAWRLRIWHDLPYCVATAHNDPASPVTATASPLQQQTEVMLRAAQTAGHAVAGVTADELYELVTALSWGIDRYGDDEPTARRRVLLATAGVFHAPGTVTGPPAA